MRVRLLAGLAVLSTVFGLAPTPAAATPAAAAAAASIAATATVPSARSTITPVRSCPELVGEYRLDNAVTHVDTAALVAARGTEPEHCDVRGYVEPAVRFHLRLPTTTFVGRYLQYGCGGLCGEITQPAFPPCVGTPRADVAVAATDDGHVGGGLFATLDGRWAADNEAAREDWFFRAPHVVSRAAKHLIAHFYGAPPSYSYFAGCSNGGREALLLAQRYPDDFDGIIAAAPAAAINPLAGMYQAWLARANTGADGTPILSTEKLPVLHQAVVAACDNLDGLTDGMLADPRACRFDPAEVRCRNGDNAECLTAAQVDAARRLYAGPVDERGRRLYPGGQPYGSELAWYPWVIPDPQYGGSIAGLLADNALRYVSFPIGSPHSSLADITFTLRDFRRLTSEGVKGNALSLDLRRFRDSGGRLIIWHGWSDQAIPPDGTLDYYQRLWQRDGGLGRTLRYARLFMVPSMYHCEGGEELTNFDPFPQLVRWVEDGAAPDRVVAEQRDAQGGVGRTYPVFRYPLRARYDGDGSVDDAEKLRIGSPVEPAPRHHFLGRQ